MKKILLLATAAALTAQASAQTETVWDSTRVERLQEVVVSGVRAQKNAPFAVSNLKKRELNAFAKTGRELPMLFAQTPGVVAWGENGLGTGTGNMTIRGAMGSRINVTLDGVPLNSPEDQTVFWANMNSYGSLLGSVQIQRGVGTSTNGDGAFGGTIALQTATPLPTPQLEVSLSYGSYNTMNVGGNFSSGLLGQHVILTGAYHETQTDGYIHGTDGRSGSYLGSATYLGDGWVLSYKNIGNFEKTGQAWNGVTAGTGDLSIMDGTYGAQTGIHTYKDMYAHGLGRYNDLYETIALDDSWAFVQDASGNYQTERYKLSDGRLWAHATDNFWQNHNLLSLTGSWADHWSGTATVHYTYGRGYYVDLKRDKKLAKYGMTFTDSEGNNVKRTDFIRKKGMMQNTYGVVGSINYKDDRWDVIAGLSAQEFVGYHYGRLTYMANPEMRAHFIGQNDYYLYYTNDVAKLDASAYLKASYLLTEGLAVFGDVQVRHVGYEIQGINDNFHDDGSSNNIDVDKRYYFVNPKAGFSWQQGPHRVYGSAAYSHREPERNNFTDNGSYPAPKAEKLLDVELGYTLNQRSWRVGLNGYWMDYTNQFVKTGAKSDIGEALTTNIKDSYRLGVELQAGWDVTPWLTLEGNAALSKNKIKDFDEVVETYDDDWTPLPPTTIHYSNSTLAVSPSTILNGFINLHYDGFQLTWHTNYVSRQYLDNTEHRDRSLPCYSVSNATLSYATPLKSLAVKEAIFSLSCNNVFSRRYAPYGWVYSAILHDSHPADNRYYQLGFMGMAGFNMMGNVTLRF